MLGYFKPVGLWNVSFEATSTPGIYLAVPYLFTQVPADLFMEIYHKQTQLITAKYLIDD